MKLEQRLSAIEARQSAGDRVAARQFCDNLLAFVEDVFPADPQGCRMDDLARLSGLPSSRYMKTVLLHKFSEEAIQTAAQSAYGDNWREPMKATMDRALAQVIAVHGDSGLEQAAKAFPPALIAARLACGTSVEATA